MDVKTHTDFDRNDNEGPPLYIRNDPIREAAPEQPGDDPDETERLLSGSVSAPGRREDNDFLDDNARMETSSPQLESGANVEPDKSFDDAQRGVHDGEGGQFGTSKSSSLRSTCVEARSGR